MSVKAKVEAIIYATEEPVTLNQLVSLLREPVLAELRAAEEARLAPNETTSDGPVATEPVTDAESVQASDEAAGNEQPSDASNAEAEKAETKQVKAYLSQVLEELTAEYAAAHHGVEVRQVAGGYRMGTKPEHHDVVVGFAKSLKPPVKLSLQALETLAVIAYKQPVTVPEISEIRGVDSSGVIATLLDRKLVTTGGRKQVIGRPILYKTTKEFLMRFGLNNVSELPSMEEFEKLGDPQAELFEGSTEGSGATVVAPAIDGTETVGGPSEEAEPDARDAPAELDEATKNSQE
jgi:segregation and condensation protein B